MFYEIFYNQKRRKRTPLQYISIPSPTLKQEEALLCPIILSAHITYFKIRIKADYNWWNNSSRYYNVYKFVVVERT